MKTPVLRLGKLLFALAVAAVTGCNSSSAVNPPATPDPTAYQPATAIPQVPAAPGEPAAAPRPPLPEPKLDFTPSANLADMIKLARAGVSESLMLKFIQNASGAFGLGAQKIIYLNDLGVSENVINTMMERDRAFTNALPPAPAPLAGTAPAPAPVVAELASVVVTAPAPVTVNYFYETLTPYGSWIEVEGYGLCWQPTVVIYQSDWQPYCDRGRWVYTDCGWYWASDYSWGNVAFHYGRWFKHHRRGWCWAPDTVWAPAWVSWRRNDNYCGWAPLPPAACYRPGVGFFYQDRAVSIGFEFGLSIDCYTFVSRHHFTDPHPRRHAAPRQEVTQIYNTTIVNNYYSGGGRNERVVNHGIAPAVITAGTANQIRPVRAPEPAAPGVRPDRDQITAPTPGRDARPARPQADSLTPKFANTTPRAGVISPTDRTVTPDRNRENNSTRERESAFHRATPEATRTTPERNLTPATPTKPAPVLTPNIAAPAITTPTVREREIRRPNVVGPNITRPAPFDHENRSSIDSSRNSDFRTPSSRPIPAAPTVNPATPRLTPTLSPFVTRPAMPQINQQPDRSERPSTFSIPSRSFTTPEPRSQPSMPPRHPTPQTPAPPPRPQPAAPSFTPAPQPSFTPRSAPAMPAAPTSSAPRMESRPTPAPTAPARSESRSGGGDREKRDR